MTEKLVALLSFSIVFCAALLIMALLACAVGWLGGWTVSLFFNDTILSVLAQFGLRNVTLPELGCTGGFVSAFFRTHTTLRKEK